MTNSQSKQFLLLALLALLNWGLFALLGIFGFAGAERITAMSALTSVIVVAWFSRMNADLTAAAKQQADASVAQSTASSEQVKLALEEMRRSTTPYVVVQSKSNDTGYLKFFARNLGSGPAVNVVWLCSRQDLAPIHIGSLAPGEERILPDYANDILVGEARSGPMAAEYHYVLAEPVTGSDWIAIEHKVEDSARASNRVTLFTVTPKLLDAINRPTFDQVLAQATEHMASDLFRG